MSTQLCTFALDELLLAVPVDEVQEVIREGGMTAVPLAPPTVHGLINLRGQIVTVLDLRRCLGLEASPRAADMHVVLRREGNAVSLLVDDIGDVIEVDDAASAPPPKTIRGLLRQLLAHVCKLEDQLLLVLDSKQLTNMILAEVSK